MRWLEALPVFALVLTTPPSLTQARRDTSATLNRLEHLSEQAYVVPDSLAALVNISQAAVVGRVVGFGDLAFLEDAGPRGQVIAFDAFASYQVAITHVFFNRRASDGPALAVGQTTFITQAVGGRDARAFVRQESPVGMGDECLMFLWHRPGSGSWSVLQWPLQFRRSATIEGGAESVSLLPDNRSFLTRARLGALVPVTEQSAGRVIADWASLLAEVKRLGGLVGPQ